ncbi:MAG: GAF domain-containing protein [Chloroflexi bacterium]|nr:GAF domain-containing protein [Chloroflexota bacterium]
MTESTAIGLPTNGQDTRFPGEGRAQPVLPTTAHQFTAPSSPEPPATVPLYRFVPLRLFGATLLVVAAEHVATAWRQPGLVAALGLVVAACGLIIVVFHVLVGRRLWALIRANQRLAEGDLAAAALPVPRVRDEIDLVLAWRNHMLGRLIAVSQENARLYLETDATLRQRVRDLGTLYAVTRALVAAPDLGATLRLIVDRLVEVARARRGAILLLDRAAGKLDVRAAYQFPPDRWTALADELGPRLLRRDEATGELALACDPLALTPSEGDQLQGRLCFPLTVAGRPVGGVYLEREGIERFDANDLRLIAALTEDAALALEQARLAEAAAQAEAYRQANALKSEFLANVSHDLKTPLTFIYGMAELLATRPFDEAERHGHLAELAAAAKRMATMIDELVDLSRLEAGQLELQPAPLDLGALLRDAVALFADRSPRHRLMVETPPVLPVVIADRRRLERVVENLVSNAIRYSPDGGTVTVRAVTEGRKVVIEVEDQGIGIPPEEVPRIFGRFYRVRSPTTAGIAGTGLGLAIVKRLVQAHGGTIDVRSEVGRGSVFRIALPVAAQTVAD